MKQSTSSKSRKRRSARMMIWITRIDNPLSDQSINYIASKLLSMSNAFPILFPCYDVLFCCTKSCPTAKYEQGCEDAVFLPCVPPRRDGIRELILCALKLMLTYHVPSATVRWSHTQGGQADVLRLKVLAQT